MPCGTWERGQVHRREGSRRWGLRRGTANRGRALLLALAICTIFSFSKTTGQAQEGLPFQVSNPRHLKWPVEQAARIYSFACELVSRSMGREKAGALNPKFVLVLGAKENQTVRAGQSTEIHLRKWDSARFAEAVVLVTMRETIRDEDVVRLAKTTLEAAQSSVSVGELRREPQ